MAISPPTDLVLDVVRAAEPAAARMAASRLERLSYAAASSSGVDGSPFADALKDSGGDDITDVPALPGGTGGARVAMYNATSVNHGTLSPAQKFEAMILQQFVDGMLPDDAESVYGSGTAGGIWKSMLAEQISTQIAARGGIGIADFVNSSLKARA
ncbi:rod-binding protein [Pannonibacter carbonis]|uniref:rod-binding protein n=1 Tax=Pannonibacter carbonis TaxID=2067569 RepID=UPI000D104722|nr:rod-binding protein [Pannonibacter carbonis]